MSKKNQMICPRCAVEGLANIDAILPENIGWGISMSLGFDKINITVAITDPESGYEPPCPKGVKWDKAKERRIVERQLAVILAVPKQVEVAVHEYLSSFQLDSLTENTQSLPLSPDVLGQPHEQD